MDLATIASATAISTRTTPDSESDTPPRPTPTNKPMGFLAYTNGALTKRHYPTAPAPPKPDSPATRSPPVSYKECMRNHAASLGGHALDGCCEFMPSPDFNPADPTSLRCAACGCHRNFHRRDPDDPAPLQLHRQIKTPPTTPPPFHHPAPPSAAAPPTPATYSSAPAHMLMALRGSKSGGGAAAADNGGGGGKKRFRTRFTEEQKAKMFEFAERLGWKMQKVDKGMVEGFCKEVGVGREVLKVWMHNNKNTLGRKETINNGGIVNATVASSTNGGGQFENVHLASANASSSSD